MPVIRRALGANTQQMRDLRQNSPLAGMLGEHERARIVTRLEATRKRA
jgi:hypothetical protein